MRFALLLLAALVILLCTPKSSAQEIDSTLTWRSYHAQRSARVLVFESDDDRRPYTAVIDDASRNGGPITDEAAYVAETIGRTFGFDPAESTFVFRFEIDTPGGDSANKVLLLKATFRRVSSGGLGTPSWRVISEDTLSELTDRAL
ncbi:MAG: hypothetical protein R3284_02400 [Rubricoccaceae bacterium]|nr:hypothetical protein [Rubricoccaceae bacterium]